MSAFPEQLVLEILQTTVGRLAVPDFPESGRDPRTFGGDDLSVRRLEDQRFAVALAVTEQGKRRALRQIHVELVQQRRQRRALRICPIARERLDEALAY